MFAARPGYLVSPAFDGAFIFLAPVLAVLAGVLSVIATGNPRDTFGLTTAQDSLLIAGFIHAHLVIVFARSHLDPAVFRTFRARFLLAPPLLLLALLASGRVRAGALILASLWDIYHSAQQTFGLGRIYDRLAGNTAEAGRAADRWLNHLVYTAPALAGLALVPQIGPLTRSFEDLGGALFMDTLPYARAWRPWVAALLLGAGLPFVAWYVGHYVRLARRGYRVSWPKVTLLATTALCSIWMWGFNPYGRAWFVVNFFHALQYFAIVAWAEKGRLGALLGRPDDLPASLGLLAVAGGLYGLFAVTVARQPFATVLSVGGIAFCVSIVVSLLHFWFDGFVWSVRRGQV
jgi:hypothetical protein